MHGLQEGSDDGDNSNSQSDVHVSDAESDDFRIISVSKGNRNEDSSTEPTTSEVRSSVRQTAVTKRDKGDPRGTEGDSDGIGKRPRGCPKPESCGAGQTLESEHLTKWVQSAISMQKESGKSFTEMVRRNKNFRNPAIFEKMISYCGIDEFGTNLPPLKPLKEDEFYEAIADFQEVCMKEGL